MTELLEERYGWIGRQAARLMHWAIWMGVSCTGAGIGVGVVGGVLRFVFEVDITPDPSGEFFNVVSSTVLLFLIICAFVAPFAIGLAVYRWLLVKWGITTNRNEAGDG